MDLISKLLSTQDTSNFACFACFVTEVQAWTAVHAAVNMAITKIFASQKDSKEQKRVQKAIGYGTAAFATGSMALGMLVNPQLSLPSVTCAIGYIVWDSLLLSKEFLRGHKVAIPEVVHHATFSATAMAGALLQRPEFDRMMLLMTLAELNTAFLQTRIALRCRGYHIFHFIYQLNLFFAGATGLATRLAPHFFVSCKLVAMAVSSTTVDTPAICSAFVSFLVLAIDADLLWRLFRAENIAVPDSKNLNMAKNSGVLENRQWVARMPSGGFLDVSSDVSPAQAKSVALAVLQKPRYASVGPDALLSLREKLVVAGAKKQEDHDIVQHIVTPLEAHPTLKLRYLFPVEYDLCRMVESVYDSVPMVPKGLVMSTGEVLDRPGMRHATVDAAFDMMADHPISCPLSHHMIRRINEVHGMYVIPNKGMMLSLGARIFCFLDVVASVGWRPLTEQETAGWYSHWIEVGKLMGIQGLDDFNSHQDFRRWWDAEMDKEFNSNVRQMHRLDAMGKASWSGICAEWMAYSLPRESHRVRSSAAAISAACIPFLQARKLLGNTKLNPAAVAALRAVSSAEAQKRTAEPFPYAPSVVTAIEEDRWEAYGPSSPSAHLTARARCPSAMRNATDGSQCPFANAKKPAAAVEAVKQHNWPIMRPTDVADDDTCGFLTKEQVATAASSHKISLIVINAKAYDISRFAQFHPGGPAMLKKYMGQDATAAFERAGHSDDAVIMMENFLVCKVRDTASTTLDDSPPVLRHLDSILESVGAAPSLAEQRSPAEWETLLLTVARQTLGADIDIGPLTQLQEAGVSSVDLVRLVGALAMHTSVPVMELLLTLPDLRSVAEALGSHASSVPSSEAELPNWVLRLPVPKPATKSNVDVWCVHPAGGEVMCFLPLASKLSGCHRAFGIRAPADEAADAVNIKDRAMAYAEVVLSESGSANIVLLGYSFGGMVAVEMAAQMQQQGKTNLSVLVLDTPGPFLPQEAAAFSAALEQRAQDGGFEAMMEQAQRDGAMAEVGGDAAMRAAFRAQSMAGWVPDKEVRRIKFTLLRCEELNDAYYAGMRMANGEEEGYAERVIKLRDYGWGAAVKTVQVIDVPGDHMNVLQEGLDEVVDVVNQHCVALFERMVRGG